MKEESGWKDYAFFKTAPTFPRAAPRHPAAARMRKLIAPAPKAAAGIWGCLSANILQEHFHLIPNLLSLQENTPKKSSVAHKIYRS
jgi:hypothetical protein